MAQGCAGILIGKVIYVNCKNKLIIQSSSKLWKLLIDKNMKRKDLQEIAGISSASIAKLGKGEKILVQIYYYVYATHWTVRLMISYIRLKINQIFY